MTRKKPKIRKNWDKTPDAWTPEAVVLLKQAFSIGCSVTEACLHAKISRSTFYLHCPEGSEKFDEYMALQETPILKARHTVVAALGNVDDARWYLKNKKRDEFAEKQIHEQEKPEPVDFDEQADKSRKLFIPPEKKI